MDQCDRNCFSCIYEDCINDEFGEEDFLLSEMIDLEILKKRNPYSWRFLTEERKEELREYRRTKYKEDKERKRAKHTNVYECKNENVLEYWKEWRRRKLSE